MFDKKSFMSSYTVISYKVYLYCSYGVFRSGSGSRKAEFTKVNKFNVLKSWISVGCSQGSSGSFVRCLEVLRRGLRINVLKIFM